MSRRLKLHTRELGDLQLFLIYETNGEWELPWRPLQGSTLSKLVTSVSKEMMDHALHGWTQPFVKAIGPEGNYLLRKLPDPLCHKRAKCIYYDPPRCVPQHPSMPWCYEPGGLDSLEARRLAAEIVGYWRTGVRVVLVQEVVDAAR